MYDIIIIGAGPAGISAGIYAVSRGKRALVLEKGRVGGIIGKVSTVTHYTAIETRETGATFAARMKEQALRSGVEIVYANVTGVTLTGEVKTVTTDKGTYEAKRVILANGGTPRKLGIPGEAELTGKGMGMNAARDGAAYTGKNIYVVGGADGAVKEALYLASFAKQLTIIHFEDQLGCIAEFRQRWPPPGTSSCVWPPGSMPSMAGTRWSGWRLPMNMTATSKPWRTPAAASSCMPAWCPTRSCTPS